MFLFTIREAILRGTLIFYFAFANIIIAFFAIALRLSPEDGKTILLLGNPVLPRLPMDFDPVDFLLIQLQRSSTTSALLFGVFAVAGLIPSMLEKGTVDLFLSKPLSRTSLLLSRALGASTGVVLNLMYFAIGMWLVFGINLGVWHWKFLLSVVAVCVAFTFFFSIVAISSLITRSTGFSIMFAFAYTMFSSAIQARELTLFKWWDNVVYHRTLDAIYYATPQLSDMLEKATRIIGKLPFERGPWDQSPAGFDMWPFVYSLLSASVIYFLSIRYFSKQDF